MDHAMTPRQIHIRFRPTQCVTVPPGAGVLAGAAFCTEASGTREAFLISAFF
jgi:hypothetical protein